MRGSNLPLSIIIVGVGGANFDAMDTLDADQRPLYSDAYKKYMARDIVQFVPYEDFRNDPYKLAKEVLGELPGQVVDYFMSRGITPQPAKAEQRAILEQQLSMRSKVNTAAKID